MWPLGAQSAFRVIAKWPRWGRCGLKTASKTDQSDIELVFKELLEAHVPGDGGNGGGGAKLVDDVARNDVNVVVAQLDLGELDPVFTAQRVQLGKRDPTRGLCHGRFVGVDLQGCDEVFLVLCVE